MSINVEISSGHFKVSWNNTQCECVANGYQVSYSTLDHCGIETSVNIPSQTSTVVVIPRLFSRVYVKVLPLKINNEALIPEPFTTVIEDVVTSGK